MNLPSLPVVLSLLCASLPCNAVAHQQEEKSSRREAAVIAAVAAAGGRVNKISAVDNDREVFFHLSRKPVGDNQLKDISAIRDIIWCNLAGTQITDDVSRHSGPLAGIGSIPAAL